MISSDEFSTLRLSVAEGVGLLCLDAPEKRNAMTPQLTAEFQRAVDRLQRDEAVRAVVLTGTGTTFCAGGDLETLQAQLEWTPEQNRRHMAEFYRAYLSILRLEVPVIAALNGHAIGAGVCLALGCDIRLAAAGAKLGVTFLNLGLHPGMGTTHLLPQAVGYANAAELIFTGRVVDAEEALRMGLVSRVVPASELLEASLAIAREIAAKPSNPVRMAKRALVRQKLSDLEAALDYEAAAQMNSFASAEMREAIASLRRPRSVAGGANEKKGDGTSSLPG